MASLFQGDRHRNLTRKYRLRPRNCATKSQAASSRVLSEMSHVRLFHQRIHISLTTRATSSCSVENLGILGEIVLSMKSVKECRASCFF